MVHLKFGFLKKSFIMSEPLWVEHLNHHFCLDLLNSESIFFFAKLFLLFLRSCKVLFCINSRFFGLFWSLLKTSSMPRKNQTRSIFEKKNRWFRIQYLWLKLWRWWTWSSNFNYTSWILNLKSDFWLISGQDLKKKMTLAMMMPSMTT